MSCRDPVFWTFVGSNLEVLTFLSIHVVIPPQPSTILLPEFAPLHDMKRHNPQLRCRTPAQSLRPFATLAFRCFWHKETMLLLGPVDVKQTTSTCLQAQPIEVISKIFYCCPVLDYYCGQKWAGPQFFVKCLSPSIIDHRWQSWYPHRDLDLICMAIVVLHSTPNINYLRVG
jgi:hypothetical protein